MSKVAGEGSLQAMEQPERTCRRWRMQVRTGRDYVNGGYSRRTRVFRGTKTEARKAPRSFISEVESGLRVDKANLSFAAYAVEWVKEREASGEISKGTLRKNEYHVSAMLPYIGNVRVVDIDADTVARLVVKLRNEGGKRCAGLSGTSVRGMFVTLSHMLGDAVTRDMLLANPCSKVKPPDHSS
ncbi:MAG: phage integrase SAM-like domain-containing protein [Gordonibacter sp.]|uniref:phage integrase SAM-like domain-containing protein n=1 Tax=Gordonibacter sp. TaxID=1968902 RepID=UPI002FC59424